MQINADSQSKAGIEPATVAARYSGYCRKFG